MSENWKKALPLFLNGAFYIALGVFAVLGTIPAVFAGIVSMVGLGVQIWMGVSWKPPQVEDKTGE